jgi:putative zinc finger protein
MHPLFRGADVDSRELTDALRHSDGSDRQTWRCPDESTLAAFVDNRLGLRRRARVERHLADCGACRRLIAIQAQLDNAPEAAPLPADVLARARQLPSNRGRSFGVLWRWPTIGGATAVAAMLLLVLYGGAHRSSTTPITAPPDTAVRGIADDAGPRLLAPAADEVVEASRLEVRWTAVPSAVSYEVRITTDEGDPVWSGRESASETRLPAGVSFSPGRRYFAWVTAHLPGNRTLRSAAVPFQVRQ